MTRREALLIGVPLVLGLAFGALVSRLLIRSKIQGPIKLQVLFDGGYLFDLSGKTAVNVDALKGANYPMKVRVLTTSGSPEFEVLNGTLKILPDGAAASAVKPVLPPYQNTQTGCNANDQFNPNNELFIPNLSDVANEMGTTIKSSLDPRATFALTGGGEISVRQVGGCVQFRGDASGAYLGEKRSMASGLGGIMYEWRNIAFSYVRLQVEPFNGGNAMIKDITPNGNNVIVLRVSSFENPPSSYPTPPYRIDHFKAHFDDAFDTINGDKRISLWWLGPYLTSPGIDCPPGSAG